MARKRMISPEFWTDEKLGECTRDERLLFMGLISNADDEGRGRGNVKLIKSAIFPYDNFNDTDIERMLIALIGKKLVYVYVVDGQQFYYLPNFEKHQTINKPSESKLPEMPEEIQLPSYYGNTTVAVTPNKREKKRREEKGKEENIPPDGAPVTDPFNMFWDKYPRKVAKDKARKAFDKINPELYASVIAGLEKARASPEWKKNVAAGTLEFIPHAATWLNGKRWEDEPGKADPQQEAIPDQYRFGKGKHGSD